MVNFGEEVVTALPVWNVPEPLVTVQPGPAGRVLEGRSRPGFFDGVLTVVLKLFHLTEPDAAAVALHGA